MVLVPARVESWCRSTGKLGQQGEHKLADSMVPEDFLPVYNDAIDYYPQLGGDRGQGYPPFGYHVTDGGAWACDGRRLHVEGELPDEQWARVLEFEAHHYGFISIEFNDTFVADPMDEGVAALVSLDRLDDQIFSHEKSYAVGMPPEGFLVRRSYLLDALDFIFKENDDHQREFAVCYHQGVFELFRWEDNAELSSLLRRRCYIAGHLGSQWLLPVNEWLVRLEQGPQFPSIGSQVSGGYESQLEEKVSTTYPFPLAYSYRLPLGAESAIEESIQLLRAGENVLAFLGSVLLALTAPADRPGLKIKPDLLWERGITPGGWLNIVVKRTAEMLVRSDEELASTLAHRVLDKRSKGGVSDALASLVQMKNDQKHDRAFGSEAASSRENAALRSAIDRVYEALEFLARHPLRLIYALDVRRDSHCFVLDCFRYEGAHVHPRRELLEWYEALPTGQLYLEVSPANLVPLYPFLHRGNCPKCDANEIFFVDKLPGKGKAVMKSFEHGHTLESPVVALALARWFG